MEKTSTSLPTQRQCKQQSFSLGLYDPRRKRPLQELPFLQRPVSDQLGWSCSTTLILNVRVTASSQVEHHLNSLKKLDIMSIRPTFVTTHQQLRLDLDIAVEREIDGVGMGVLSDGTPFLNIRGLARMCGVDHAQIIRITSDWIQTPLRPREQKIRELVRAQGADDRVAFIAIHKNGTIHHSIPDAVCMAILEYYAFEARAASDTASRNYRILARKGFQAFIYAQVGYNPSGSANVAWRQFHDRVSLTYHTVPDGYFSVFKEVASLLVTLIREGANLGQSFIPDISIGQRWSSFWKQHNLEVIYGARLRYEHNYPAYFPQAASNPQLPFCYPDDALGEFRKWVREEYVAKHMPTYLNDKVRQGQIAAPAARAALDAFTPKRLASRTAR